MAHELTPEQIIDIHKIYERFKEQDGLILKANLLKAFEGLGFKLKAEDNDIVLKEINSIERINLNLFVDLSAKIHKRHEIAIQFEDACNAYAKEGENKLSVGTLMELLMNNGPNLSEEEAKELLNNLDFEEEFFMYKKFIEKEF